MTVLSIHRAAVIALVVAPLAACANITARTDTPAKTTTLNRSLDDAARCIVSSLDSEPAAWGAPKITHSIQIRDPGRVYEIAPQQHLAPAGEMYFVRLTAEGNKTRAELFSLQAFVTRKPGLIEACQ